MSQTITLKNFILGLFPFTPTDYKAGYDVNIQAGVNALYTLPATGPCLVVAFIKFKAIGSALQLVPRLANSAVATDVFVNGEVITDAGGTRLIVPTALVRYAISDLTTPTHFCLWNFGSLGGTYTIDYRFEYYPVSI